MKSEKCEAERRPQNVWEKNEKCEAERSPERIWGKMCCE